MNAPEGSARPRSSPSAWRRASAGLPAIAVALLPKCPACWSVYAGLSSLLGISFVLEPGTLRLLVLLSLAVALGTLAAARKQSGWLPLGAGAASALAIWLGKFELFSDPLTIAGALGLLGSTLAARWLARRAARQRALARAIPSGSELAQGA